MLEIGSFEGRSTLFFLENILKFHPTGEIHCIDTWQGGQEHKEWDMQSVEQRFFHNINQFSLVANKNADIVLHKGYSHQKMMELLVSGYQDYFDFIYIDGSHEAPDVLLDALLAHKLVRVGGIIAFDDYLWSPTEKGQEDHYLLVKPAVDHYVNTYQQNVFILQNFPLYQLYVQKLK